MIDYIKDELKDILNDLEKINETSDIDQIISKLQEFYKKLIIFQFKKENENTIDGSNQKEVNTAMETINEIVTEIPDERDIESVDDLFSSVANPEFIIKENNDNEILNESKKLNESLIKGIKIGLNDKIAFTKGLFDGSEEDFSRVVSQLQTYSSWDEAFDFLNNIVKPDYNNWEGKEEIEKRFLKCIENNF
ncbi:MAG: hypothetical protein CMC48_05400 [Flavobacteriaceae bacterium]|nr:hypothetical protein [Flavobacteriaceae bacterium]|tara:strand:+ start:3060 stop:3635 length:576 start_codon:yes stop_codon:yes gene_type:complete